jgi:manganese transport protein
VALLASGLSRSVTGTMAGQGIMGDFLAWRVPASVRRLVTLLPALAIAALSADATRALVLSQVVLSLVLPVPMLALLIATSRRRIMGKSRTLRQRRSPPASLPPPSSRSTLRLSSASPTDEPGRQAT